MVFVNKLKLKTFNLLSFIIILIFLSCTNNKNEIDKETFEKIDKCFSNVIQSKIALRRLHNIPSNFDTSTDTKETVKINENQYIINITLIYYPKDKNKNKDHFQTELTYYLDNFYIKPVLLRSRSTRYDVHYITKDILYNKTIYDDIK